MRGGCGEVEGTHDEHHEGSAAVEDAHLVSIFNIL